MHTGKRSLLTIIISHLPFIFTCMSSNKKRQCTYISPVWARRERWSWCCGDSSTARRRGVEKKDRREKQRDARDTGGTRRGCYGENGQQRGCEQQNQAQQDGLINNNIAFSVNAALLLPLASAAPHAAVSTVCTTQKPFAKKLRLVSD